MRLGHSVAERFKARVRSWSLAGIVGSNPAWGGGMHGFLSLVSVAYRQVDVSATGRSLMQTDCGVPLRVIQKPREWGGPGPRWAVIPEINFLWDLLFPLQWKPRQYEHV